MMMEIYTDFITTKELKHSPSGFSPTGLNKHLLQFQSELTKLALRRGRSAIFASTGLGKTLMQLAWADKICEKTKGSALILTPLAVAYQTVAEAKKFNIKGVSYAEGQTKIETRISVSNYDRLDRFDPSQFSAIVLDESSILKNLDGKTRTALIEAFTDTPYKLCATATPAPNDFTELGNHAEFLNITTFKEMLATYFIHDGGNLIDASSGFRGWRLKRHAEKDFWRWVSSWASILNHPRDLGFDEDGYDLPELIKHQVIVDDDTPFKKSVGFLPTYAKTLNERLQARRDSTDMRVEAAAKIVNTNPKEPWLIWCGLNTEAERITKMISGAEEVRGSDDTKDKIDKLLGFCKGNPLKLVTKAKIAGFGMNWQHCHNMIFLGLNDSFEQMFQAIRRCWRFGQQHPVHVYIVLSAYEGEVLKNIERKERDHQRMVKELCNMTKDWLRYEISHNHVNNSAANAQSTITLPKWLKAR
jgi:hypothetical protein